MKSRAAALLAVWLAALLPAGAQHELTRDQVAAFLTLSKADQARDGGAWDAATAAYEEALEAYKAIREKDARWHPGVVQARIDYCSRELAKIKKASPAVTSPAGVPVPVPPALPREAREVQSRASGPAGPASGDEVAALKRKIQVLQDEAVRREAVILHLQQELDAQRATP